MSHQLRTRYFKATPTGRVSPTRSSKQLSIILANGIADALEDRVASGAYARNRPVLHARRRDGGRRCRRLVLEFLPERAGGPEVLRHCESCAVRATTFPGGLRRDRQPVRADRRAEHRRVRRFTGGARETRRVPHLFLLAKPLASGMAGTAVQDGEKRMPSERQRSHDGERRAVALPARFGRLATGPWFPGVGTAAKIRGAATIAGARHGNRMQTNVVRFRTY